jgi:hypothetical protein
MVQAVHATFPQELLPNGDVILFPEDWGLRAVISEPPQDFFRDTGWHWRWIRMYLEKSATTDGARKEIDIYAAEILSEFLSVLGVAMIELTERVETASNDSPVDGKDIRQVYQSITNYNATDSEHTQRDSSSYSPEVRRQILANLRQPMFEDVTGKVNLEFEHKPSNTLWTKRATLEVPVGIAGGGVSSGDIDGDGYPELYFAGNRGGRLFRNVEGKRFQNVTAESGVALRGETRAGYFIDFDNDGDQDLFFTVLLLPNRLLENNGSGGFRDVTEEVGLQIGNEMTHEAVWFDMNNDGLLDLYTANFGNWAQKEGPTLGRRNVNGGPNNLYKHHVENGRHLFVEVGAEMGVDDRGWTHCVGAFDFDRDGFMDLMTLNDFGASLVYRNEEGKRFTETARKLHLDAMYNAMSLSFMDLDHNGNMSIYVSQILKLVHRQRYRKPTEDTQIVFGKDNLKNMRTLIGNRLYEKRPDGAYDDVHETRLEPVDTGWAWDASGFDYENDGDLEILILNCTETVIPIVQGEKRERFIFGRAYLSKHADQRNVFYLSEAGYHYDVSEHSALSYVGNSRGSTFFDFDLDGDVDVAISDYNAPGRIFENRQDTGNSWVRLELEGTKSNRDAIGARVEIHFGNQVRHAQVFSRKGFLSQNPRGLHFGIGKATEVDRAIVTWPSGSRQELLGLAVNQIHKIRESS